jgi:hypothetical protein
MKDWRLAVLGWWHSVCASLSTEEVPAGLQLPKATKAPKAHKAVKVHKAGKGCIQAITLRRRASYARRRALW